MYPSIQKSISLCLIVAQICIVSIGQLYSREYIHTIYELPSYMDETTDIRESQLVQERQDYINNEDHYNDTYYPVDSIDDRLTQNIIIERQEIIEGKIQNTTITSKLLQDTLVRNMHYTAIASEDLGIHPASVDAIARAQDKIEERQKTDAVVFEF